MKRSVAILRTITAVFVVILLLSSCSRKNINMSKHRKSRKCNCPTFAENRVDDSSTVYYD